MGYTVASALASAIAAVHPHTRGVYVNQARPDPTSDGSSPHTWGIPGVLLSLCVTQRFIPTHVGYTTRTAPWVSSSTVHPHTRGVYVLVLSVDIITNGSSPHTWGIHLPPDPDMNDLRFIPTHVGYTPATDDTGRLSAVHPHTRGVYGQTYSPDKILHGSSPHTWGIRESPDCDG